MFVLCSLSYRLVQYAFFLVVLFVLCVCTLSCFSEGVHDYRRDSLCFVVFCFYFVLVVLFFFFTEISCRDDEQLGLVDCYLLLSFPFDCANV